MSFSITAAAEDKTEKTSNEQQQGKIEQPPLSYGLYLPGDEDVYKVKINPITPAEGINTGALLYYGHLVRPPYKVEMVYKYYRCKVLVNNLDIVGFDNNIMQSYSEGMIKQAFKDSPEQMQKQLDMVKQWVVVVELSEEYMAMEKKYDMKQPEAKAEMLDDYKSYLDFYMSQNSMLTDYRYDETKGVQVQLRTNNIGGAWRDIPGNIGSGSIMPESMCREMAETVELTFQGDYVESAGLSTRRIRRQKTLAKVAEIMAGNDTRDVKIKKLTGITRELGEAKFLYYNFDNEIYQQITEFRKKLNISTKENKN
jgi:hypothetical protein